MKTISYNTLEKSVWGEGPWTSEPDKLQWRHRASGLPCLIVRNVHVTGALCGYVGVPKGHRCFGKYEGGKRNPVDKLRVHGGITFGNFCRPNADEARDICHVVSLGEEPHVWWLGFDCSHAGDFSPMLDSTLRAIPSIAEHRAQRSTLQQMLGEYEKYRDLAYVKREVSFLARQLAAMA
jgi:hypothetical protein